MGAFHTAARSAQRHAYTPCLQHCAGTNKQSQCTQAADTLQNQSSPCPVKHSSQSCQHMRHCGHCNTAVLANLTHTIPSPICDTARALPSKRSNHHHCCIKRAHMPTTTGRRQTDDVMLAQMKLTREDTRTPQRWRPGQQTWHACTHVAGRPGHQPLLLPVKSRESTSQLHARRTHKNTCARFRRQNGGDVNAWQGVRSHFLVFLF